MNVMTGKMSVRTFVTNKDLSRILTLVLSLLLCISIFGIIASAATVSQDGLEVTLTADKEKYSATEPIVATLTVENKSDKIIDEVSLETLIPDGYHIDTTATAVKTVGELGIGEKAILEVTLIPDTPAMPDTPDSSNTPVVPVPVSPGSDDQSGADSANQSSPTTSSSTSKEESVNSSTTTTTKSSTTSTTNKTSTKTPATASSKYPVASATGSGATSTQVKSSVKNVNTGDESSIWVWVAIALLSGVGLAGLIVKKRNVRLATFGISSMLIVGLLSGGIESLSFHVKAKGLHSHSIETSSLTNVDGKQLKLNGIAIVNPNILDYDNGDFLYIPTEDNIDYDEDSSELFFDNYILAYMINPLSEKELDKIAQSVDGIISGVIDGPANVVQIKVKKSTKKELTAKAKLLVDDNIYYASYDTPLEITPDNDNNPWPDENGNLENDKGNESNPSSNDWWAEAIGAYTAWKYDSYEKPVTVGILDNGYYSHDDLPDFSYLSSFSDNHIELGSGSSHGTHVAGLISAKNNSIGIRGVADKAKVIANDYSVYRGGNLTNFVSNGEYTEIINQMLIAAKKANTPITINNSWFSVGLSATRLQHWLDDHGFNIKWKTDYTSALNDCFATASHCVANMIGYILHGYDSFLIVQSAGNGLKDEEGYGYSEGIPSIYNGSYASITEDVYNRVVSNTPTSFLEEHNINYSLIKNHLLIVGAVKNERAQYGQYYASSFSNFGETVDIFAPGEDVISTVDNNGYEPMSGTSMAAPIVCGSAAYLWSLNPELSAVEIKRLLVNSGNTAFGVGLDSQSLYPMLNIGYSVEHSPFYEKLKADEQPSTPGDITGIDDPEEPSLINSDVLSSDVARYNGHVYAKSLIGVNWAVAKDYCENVGGHLVTITSQGENDFIINYSGGDISIGLTDSDEEGIFKWINGEPVVFSQWDYGEPNNEFDEDYVLLKSTGYWNDGHLNQENWFFVCEWDSEELYENYYKKDSIVSQGSCGMIQSGIQLRKSDNVKYTLYSNGTLRIYGEGAIRHRAATYEGKYDPSMPWDSVSQQIKRVIIENGITEIGDYALTNSNGVVFSTETVSLPESLTTIGKQPFGVAKSIYFYSVKAPVLRDDPWKSARGEEIEKQFPKNATIHVPKGSSGYETWPNVEYDL